MRHGRRRDLGDTPWVTIAAVIGVIAVVAIAVMFFLGGGSGQTSGGSSSSTAGSSVAPATTLLKNTGVSSITVKETTPVSVPKTGTFVEVQYLGSFSGTYGLNSTLQKAQDSGDKVYTIDDANGTILAKFQKMDRSTNHEMTVQIWKDGKAVKFGKNSSAYGIVSIRYP